MAKYEVITCEDCTAEIDIKVLNEDELNSAEIKFCPCCGTKMVNTIEEDEDDYDTQYGEWDDQDNNAF